MKPILKTIIIAKLVALLITGLTCFVSSINESFGGSLKYIMQAGLISFKGHPPSGGAVILGFTQTFNGFPFTYVAYINGYYMGLIGNVTFYPVCFIVDFLIFFAASLVILLVINNEWRKNHKVGKKTKYEGM